MGESGSGPTLLASDVKASIAEAHEAAERVRLISRDLRSFARPDSDRRRTVDLRSVLTSALRIARHRLKRAIHVQIEADDVPVVEASEGGLGQVFLNLLVNAGQALEGLTDRSGHIRIAVRLHGEREVIVEIEDNGTGIAPEHLDRLFTPFFTTRHDEGTGLGLSISQQIMESFGGSISVESSLDQGTCFRVRVPVAQTSALAARTETKVSVPKRARVLVIDDDPLVSHAIERILTPVHDVETLASSAEAIKQLRRGARFDLILSDLEVAERGTDDLYTEVFQLAPEQAGKMAFLTRGVPDHREREFLDRIKSPYLEKPFDVARLRALLSASPGP